MNLTKKCSVGLILALVFLLLIMQSPPTVSAELTNQQKALGFLGEVVGLDLAKYDVELKSYKDYSSYANGLCDSEITYKLTSEKDQMSFNFFIKENAKFICRVSDARGSKILTQSAAGMLDAAKGFMDRYQEFAGGYIQPLKEILYNATELKNMTSVVDDLKFKIEIDSLMKDFVLFQWMYTPNGIYNRHTRISLMYHNGVLEQFSDNWNDCVVGSSEVNISKEQAIDIAKEHIAAYSYPFGNKTIDNLTIGDTTEWVSTNLSMEIKKDNQLYPIWELLIPLAKVYPGFATAMRVYLWADTGELSLIEKSGGGGGATVPETSEDDAEIIEQSTPTPSQTAINQASSTAVFTVAAFSAIVACVALMIYWVKFRKTSTQGADKHE